MLPFIIIASFLSKKDTKSFRLVCKKFSQIKLKGKYSSELVQYLTPIANLIYSNDLELPPVLNFLEIGTYNKPIYKVNKIKCGSVEVLNCIVYKDIVKEIEIISENVAYDFTVFTNLEKLKINSENIGFLKVKNGLQFLKINNRNNYLLKGRPKLFKQSYKNSIDLKNNDITLLNLCSNPNYEKLMRKHKNIKTIICNKIFRGLHEQPLKRLALNRFELGDCFNNFIHLQYLIIKDLTCPITFLPERLKRLIIGNTQNNSIVFKNDLDVLSLSNNNNNSNIISAPINVKFLEIIHSVKNNHIVFVKSVKVLITKNLWYIKIEKPEKTKRLVTNSMPRQFLPNLKNLDTEKVSNLSAYHNLKILTIRKIAKKLFLPKNLTVLTICDKFNSDIIIPHSVFRITVLESMYNNLILPIKNHETVEYGDYVELNFC